MEFVIDGDMVIDEIDFGVISRRIDMDEIVITSLAGSELFTRRGELQSGSLDNLSLRSSFIKFDTLYEDYTIVDPSSLDYAFVEYKSVSVEDEGSDFLSVINFNIDEEDVEMVQESKFWDEEQS